MGWTFYSSTGKIQQGTAESFADIDIDGATDIGEAIVDADLFIIDNGAGGTNRKTAASRLKTYIGSVSQANQAALEAETNEDTYVPPDLVRHSPGVAKAHAYTDGDSSGGGTLTGAYNTSAVTNDSSGRYTWTWDTDFSNANYTMIAVINETTAAGTADADRGGNTAGAGKTSTFVQVHTSDGDTLGSLPHYVVAYGDQ